MEVKVTEVPFVNQTRIHKIQKLVKDGYIIFIIIAIKLQYQMQLQVLIHHILVIFK